MFLSVHRFSCFHNALTVKSSWAYVVKKHYLANDDHLNIWNYYSIVADNSCHQTSLCMCMHEQTQGSTQEHLEKSFLIFIYHTFRKWTTLYKCPPFSDETGLLHEPPATSHQSRDHISRPGGAMAVASWLPPPPPPPPHFSNETGMFVFPLSLCRMADYTGRPVTLTLPLFCGHCGTGRQ